MTEDEKMLVLKYFNMWKKYKKSIEKLIELHETYRNSCYRRLKRLKNKEPPIFQIKKHKNWQTKIQQLKIHYENAQEKLLELYIEESNIAFHPFKFHDDSIN